MKVITKIEVCGACRRDPAFGAIHMGCANCKREHSEADKQPPLKRISEQPLIYAVVNK